MNPLYIITLTLLIQFDMPKEKIQTAYFGGGCFWCIEAVFENINGVTEVISGYSGGDRETANYKDVCSGKTKHAEICKIKYNSEIVTFDILLEIFFLSHDPTTLNRQGNDIGPQYRSVIFFSNQEEKDKSKAYIKKLEQKNTYQSIITEILPLNEFYPAENYHQNYFEINPNQPYCEIVIEPKIQKLREKLNKYYK